MDLLPDQPRLETENFVLRSIREDEIQLMHLLGLAFWNGRPAESVEMGLESIKKIVSEYTAGRCLHWCVEKKNEGSIVACVGYYRGFENSQGEIGYVVNAAHRSQGVMTEVMPRLLEYGFIERRLRKIIAVTHGDNLPSVTLLARFGFVFEAEKAEGYRQYARTPLT